MASLGRPRLKWEDKVRCGSYRNRIRELNLEDLGLSGKTKFGAGLIEIGLESLNWVNLAHNKRKLAASCEFDNESLRFFKCREFLN